MLAGHMRKVFSNKGRSNLSSLPLFFEDNRKLDAEQAFFCLSRNNFLRVTIHPVM